MGTTVYGSNLIASTLIEYLPDLYIAALRSAPDQNSTGTSIVEPSDSAYARQPINMTGTSWSSVYNGRTYYEPEVIFPTATEYWYGITHWCLCTALTGGSIVVWGSFSATGSIPAGQILVIPTETIGIYVGTG